MNNAGFRVARDRSVPSPDYRTIAAGSHGNSET